MRSNDDKHLAIVTLFVASDDGGLSVSLIVVDTGCLQIKLKTLLVSVSVSMVEPATIDMKSSDGGSPSSDGRKTVGTSFLSLFVSLMLAIDTWFG